MQCCNLPHSYGGRDCVLALRWLLVVLQVLSEALIAGMTTTGLAQQQGLLHGLRAKVRVNCCRLQQNDSGKSARSLDSCCLHPFFVYASWQLQGTTVVPAGLG